MGNKNPQPPPVKTWLYKGKTYKSQYPVPSPGSQRVKTPVPKQLPQYTAPVGLNNPIANGRSTVGGNPNANVQGNAASAERLTAMALQAQAAAAQARLGTTSRAYSQAHPDLTGLAPLAAQSARWNGIAGAYAKGGDPLNIARVIGTSNPTNGGLPPVGSSSSGGSGGYGGSSGGSGDSGLVPSSDPSVGASVTTTLADLLAQLPQGPTGLPDVQGAYSALQDRYAQMQQGSNKIFDDARAAIQKMYGDTAQTYNNTGNTEYLAALQGLNTQNQNTQLGTMDQLKSIRGAYLQDMQGSIGARSAQSVADLMAAFNDAKSKKEAQVTQDYMDQQAALQEAALKALQDSSGNGSSVGGGSSGGGGGGSRRRFSSGGSSSGSGAATETETVMNPQNMQILAELSSKDPASAAAFERLMNLNSTNPGGVLKGAQQYADTTAYTSRQANNASAMTDLWNKLGKGFMYTSDSKKKAAANSKSAANKASKNNEQARIAQAVLSAAKGLGGVLANPKVKQEIKTKGTKK